MSLNCHLLWPGGTSTPCFSFTRFIVEPCLLKKKNKYMTPAHSLKTTRPSHSVQYRRHQTYIDTLNPPPSPELFDIGMACPLLWPISSPQRGLWYSLFKQKFNQNVLLLLFYIYILYMEFYLYFFLSLLASLTLEPWSANFEILIKKK